MVETELESRSSFEWKTVSSVWTIEFEVSVGHLNRYFCQPKYLSLKRGDQCSRYELGFQSAQVVVGGARM